MLNLIETKSIDLKSANQLADAAVSKAEEMGVNIHVTVMDSAGNVLAYQRMPGAPLPAREMSEKKAYTAANFKIPTELWKDKLANKPHVATGLPQHPKIALIGGGAPVKIDDTVVGSIGIAGALEEQDIEIVNFILQGIQ